MQASIEVSVVALALQRTSDLKYLITRRGPGQTGAGEWEFPGGKIEAGESQTFALVREIQEELSFHIEEKKLMYMDEHLEAYPTKTVRIFLWKMQIDYTPEFILSEHDQFLWLSKQEILSVNLSTGDRPFVRLL